MVLYIGIENSREQGLPGGWWQTWTLSPPPCFLLPTLRPTHGRQPRATSTTFSTSFLHGHYTHDGTKIRGSNNSQEGGPRGGTSGEISIFRWCHSLFGGGADRSEDSAWIILSGICRRWGGSDAVLAESRIFSSYLCLVNQLTLPINPAWSVVLKDFSDWN